MYSYSEKKAIVTYCNSCCTEQQDITEKQQFDCPHTPILASHVGIKTSIRLGDVCEKNLHLSTQEKNF